MQIKTEGSNLVLKIPRDLISRDYVERFVERIELEMLVEKNQITDKEARKRNSWLDSCLPGFLIESFWLFLCVLW